MSRRSPRPPAPATAALDDRDPDEAFAARLGERLRRAALGLTAALIVSRPYWPGEGLRREEDSAAGLLWAGAVLLTLGLAVAAMLVGGRTRLRWSGADACVYLLMFLVGLSSTRGAERRVAINLAWEWAAVGVAYALARNLPRTRAESSALAGALMATAVAVSAYGLYQNAVELPAAQRFYKLHPAEALRIADVTPGTPAAKLFEARLLESTEPNSTFALANSLAGFLVGPAVLGLAVGLEALRLREGRRSFAPVLGALPWLVLVACLLLTKSRSAYLGLAIGAVLLALRSRGRMPAWAIGLAGVGVLSVLAAMVYVGVTTRKLDREVYTEAAKSLRYRLEYWQGAWDVITREPGAWWAGVGPGNFGDAYLRHKRAWASEEVSDPHNLVLDAWSTAGLAAAAALVLALGLGLRDILGPPRGEPPQEPGPGPQDDAPPGRTRWLIACAGGGWLLAWPLGGLDPFAEGLLPRWLVLGVAWVWAVLLGAPLWRRVPVPAAGLGAAALAVAVNLLAAGGIGFAPVALGLWTVLALGQNLREDRPCGRLRTAGGRLPAFALAAATAALIGSYYGAISPAWRAAEALEEARIDPRRPDFPGALEAANRAMLADQYAVRPYLVAAELEYRAWLARGALPEDPAWYRIDTALIKAIAPPRNRASLRVRRLEAEYAREILRRFGGHLPARHADWLRNRVADALRHAVPLYPTHAPLRAELADALAAIGRTSEAVEEAEEALRLDALTPHADKKLPDAVRDRLRDEQIRRAAGPGVRAGGGAGGAGPSSR